MEDETIIIVSVFSVAIAVLLLLVAVLFAQIASLRRKVTDLQNRSGLRVQKVTLDDRNHAFHNPAISPDEELAKRGFSMYAAEAPPQPQPQPDYNKDKDRDVESGRGSERQTGGQFVDELSQKLDQRQVRRQQELDRERQAKELREQQQFQQYQQQHQQKQSQQAPPFLLQSIEETKRRTRSLNNPVANGGGGGAAGTRQSDTNPNFIY